MTTGQRDPAAIAEAVARHSYGKLVAILAARTRDLAGAEDALGEAFAAALVDWPRNGVPQRPEGWLLATARRRLIDVGRHLKVSIEAAGHLRLLSEELQDRANEVHSVPDERLALMFACAHPAIDPAIRAPLILQVVLGFNAQEIGSAFLIAPTTMGARLSRAKGKIRTAGIPVRVPEGVDLRERLGAVLEAVYGAYASGWSDPAGVEVSERNLAEEAIWLGRLIVELLPGEAEALGLLALMLYSHARLAARLSDSGEFIPLVAQDVRHWNDALIVEAERLLGRASRLGAFGRYQLEAAIQSAHVAGQRVGRTDWPAIVRLYDGLCVLTGSPVAAINRAVAIAEASGPAAGLAALPQAQPGERLLEYQPYWAARAELCARLGDRGAAAEAYARAIGLAADPAVRRFLHQRRGALLQGDLEPKPSQFATGP